MNKFIIWMVVVIVIVVGGYFIIARNTSAPTEKGETIGMQISNVTSLRSGLEIFRQTHGYYPDSLLSLTDSNIFAEAPNDEFTGDYIFHIQRGL